MDVFCYSRFRTSANGASWCHSKCLHLHAGQLQHRRQDQKHQQRADRFSIYEKVGKSIIFRCVEVRCRNTDKRQKQQRCEKKREISDDPGVCLCRSAKQRADLCSREIDADCADCRDRSSGQVGQLSDSLNGRLVILSVRLPSPTPCSSR